MKYWCVICWLAICVGCSTKKIEPPGDVSASLRMATVGASRFEDYIHSLGIYAFRKTAGGDYVYARTLAELDADGIAALEDGSAEGNAKYFPINLPVGTYEIYLAGNAAGHLSAQWTEEVTTPSQVLITGNPSGQDSVYFLGKVNVVLITEHRPPLEVTLNRAIGKLVCVLYQIPVEIDSVQITLANLASSVTLAGETGGAPKSVSATYPVHGVAGATNDTLVGTLLTLPSLPGGSPLHLTFYAKNGQERVKEMPLQHLLPDKYIRITGHINNNPGALLSFEIDMKIYLFDYWLERPLPDFTLNKQNE